MLELRRGQSAFDVSATSQEDRRQPTVDPAVQNPRWGRERERHLRSPRPPSKNWNHRCRTQPHLMQTKRRGMKNPKEPPLRCCLKRQNHSLLLDLNVPTHSGLPVAHFQLE